MKKNLTAKILFSLFLLSSCSKESPELIPCMCDGSESTLGLFDCMCEPMKKKPVRKISYIQDTPVQKIQTLIIDDEQRDAYLSLHQNRDTYAPIKLDYVDFRIKKNRNYTDFDRKLGNYRFRIFGCRREAKNAFLNEGRTMQKDMRFFDVFYETMNDYYPVVVNKNNPYYLDSDRIEQPEYLITAEITDYFMNICDEFDWNNVKQKKLRSGSSEITITWRVMNLLRDEVYCKGTTTGYGQVSEGEVNGENLLVERAFEDALIKLPEVGCFNSTVSQRIRPEEIQQQLTVIENNQPQDTFAEQYKEEINGISALQECASGLPNQSTSIEVVPLLKKPVTTKTVESMELIPVGDLLPIGENVDINAGIGSISETGGIDGTGSTISILENGRDAALIGGVDGTGKAISVLPDGIDVACGVDCSGSSIDVLPYGHDAELIGGVDGSGSLITIQSDCSAVEITGGVSGSGGVFVQPVEDNVKISDDYWIDIPLETKDKELIQTRAKVEDSFANSTNKFCIPNQPPYQNLNAQNLYKVRASIVAVENSQGAKGAGLIISENLVLTSADLMVKDDNNFKLKTINGREMKAAAFRVNPSKNVALLSLSEPTKYTPLPLSLKLPEVEKDILLTLGMLDLDNEGEGYIDNEGKVTGYRWSEDKGAEIEVDTFVQSVTLGGALIDKHGNIVGLAHVSKKLDTSPDLFIPIETALQGLGLEICGVRSTKPKPKAVKATPLADAIDNSKDKTPIPLEGLKRK